MRGRLLQLDGRKLTIELDGDFRQQYNQLTGYKVDVDIKRHYPGRSPSANAYAWSLMRKIASKTNRDVEDIYREYLHQHGAKVTSEKVRLENAADDMEAFVKGHIGRYVEYSDKDIDSGYIEVTKHYGSSDMDQKQFGEFLDNIIEDCRLLHIYIEEKPYD